MTFAGLSDPQERANLIAYLNAQGSNLPMPPPPAAEAPAAADAGNAAGPGRPNAAEAANASTEPPPKRLPPTPIDLKAGRRR